MGDKYIIYEHIFPNGKRYIGITCRSPKERWKNGHGYAHNQYMKNAIEKYGWANVQHNILYTNLSKEVAEKEEIRLIALYKLTDRRFGYNIDKGGTTTKEYRKKQDINYDKNVLVKIMLDTVLKLQKKLVTK